MSVSAMTSEARPAVTAAIRAERLALKVPKPPERYTLPVPFPRRPDMLPATSAWIDSAKHLADEAAIVVSTATRARTAAQTCRTAKKIVADAVARTEMTTQRCVEKETIEKRKVQKELHRLNSDMISLLMARRKALDKIRSVEKPLVDLRRRIEYRSKEAPPSEQGSAELTVDLVHGADSLQRTVEALSSVCVKCERQIAYMEQLASALRKELEIRSQKLAADNSLTAQSHVDGSLPLLNRAATGDGGRGSSAKPPMSGITGIGRIAELVAAAASACVSLDRELKAASHAVDSEIVRNATLVESSVRRSVDETNALLRIIEGRITLVEKERDAVVREQITVKATINAVLGPAATAREKVQRRRKTSNTVVSDLQGLDPILVAASGEYRTVQSTLNELQQQLRVLDANHERLSIIHRDLKKDAESKRRLLEVDQRILTIGSTPRPASLASSTPRRSARMP